VADRLLAVLERDYFTNYAVVAFAHRVEVLRGDKYLPRDEPDL
jgi:hypothetical protein